MLAIEFFITPINLPSLSDLLLSIFLAIQKAANRRFVAFRFVLVRQPAKRIRNVSQPKDGFDFLKQPTQKYFAETDNKTRERRIELESNYFLFHAFSARMELLFRVFFYCTRSFDGLFSAASIESFARQSSIRGSLKNTSRMQL